MNISLQINYLEMVEEMGREGGNCFSPDKFQRNYQDFTILDANILVIASSTSDEVLFLKTFFLIVS